MTDDFHPYRIRCELTGDVAEADSRNAALVAADQLAHDYDAAQNTQGALRAARRSMIIVRLYSDGVVTYEGRLTEKARLGELS